MARPILRRGLLHNMIIQAASRVDNVNLPRFAWANLKTYQNVDYVSQVISKIHSTPSKYNSDVVKQASQIRYCLIQAKEYFDAGLSISAATKPNLYYYCIMSLCLSEILFKQNGDSSLDRARQKHRHHGLTFNINENQSRSQDIAEAASALVAKPYIGSRGPTGTFELWHKSSRQTPCVGKATHKHAGGASTTSLDVIGVPKDERPPCIPESGISFLECIKALPGMEKFLWGQNLPPLFGRGAVSVIVEEDRSRDFNFLLHPGYQDINEKIIGNIEICARSLDQIDIREVSSGMLLKVHLSAESIMRGMKWPSICAWTDEEIKIWCSDMPLNEFGYLYVALFMAGNYARYYPDRWLSDVEKNSPLALAIEELLYVAEQRMALLSLCELSRKYFVIQS